MELGTTETQLWGPDAATAREKPNLSPHLPSSFPRMPPFGQTQRQAESQGAQAKLSFSGHGRTETGVRSTSGNPKGTERQSETQRDSGHLSHMVTYTPKSRTTQLQDSAPTPTSRLSSGSPVPIGTGMCVLGGPAAKGQPGYPPYFWACPRPPGKGRQQRGGFPSYYGQTLSPQSPGARPSQPFALLEVQNTRCDTACSPLGTLPQQHGSLPPRPTASSLQPLPANSVSSRH